MKNERRMKNEDAKFSKMNQMIMVRKVVKNGLDEQDEWDFQDGRKCAK